MTKIDVWDMKNIRLQYELPIINDSISLHWCLIVIYVFHQLPPESVGSSSIGAAGLTGDPGDKFQSAV